MIIKNISQGENYQLSPDTKIEVERTNPFFHDYGEQSVPVDLPDSPHNRKILNYPERMQNVRRPSKAIDVVIQDGDYFAEARQAILSVKAGESIKTSFYMNDGSFYSRLSKTTLKEVFGSETIPGITTVAEGIAFCKSLVDHSNTNFDIFPVLVDNDGATVGKYASLGYKMINGYGELDGGTWYPRPKTSAPHTYTFYNENPTMEYVDATSVVVPAGYYISPFVRIGYVLSRVLSYFGYTIAADNFFAVTAPFNKMVLINNTMDAIASGQIYLADLVPDVTCSQLLDWYRRKFCCEFIPDEGNKTVSVCLFNDVLDQSVQMDLSRHAVSKPEVDYSGAPRHLKITHASAFSPDSNDEEESFESFDALLKKYPNAKYDEPTGRFYREGWEGTTVVKEWLSSPSMSYEYALPDSEDDVVDVEIPESVISLRKCNDDMTLLFPYVGRYRALHSKILMDNGTTISENNSEDLPIIVAIPYTSNGDYPRGGVSAYDEYQAFSGVTVAVYEYSLVLWGSRGLYEKFYRRYDALLRNTLYPVTATLNLPASMKRNIPAHHKISIDGSALLVDTLKFSLGGKPEALESQFLTLQMYEPTTVIPAFSDMFINTGYRWGVITNLLFVEESDYYAAEDWSDGTRWDRLLPPPPTADLVGIRYGERRIRYEYTPGLSPVIMEYYLTVAHI